MTLDKTVKYAGRFGDKDTNSPTGSYKNKSDSSTNDGSFLEQDWANDAYDGLNGAFLANVHDASTGEPTGYTNPFNENGTVTLNGLVDNAQASQVYNAWYKKTQDVADGRIAAKQLEEKIAELELLASGVYRNWYSGNNPIITSQWVDFNKSDSETVGNNILIDSGNSEKITFNANGTYFLKVIIYVAATDGGRPTGSFAGYKNFAGNDPSSETAVITTSGGGSTFISGDNETRRDSAIRTSGITPPNFYFSALTISPHFYFNIDDKDNDFLRFYVNYDKAVSIGLSFMRLGSSVTNNMTSIF